MPREGEELPAVGRVPHLRRPVRTPRASRRPSGDQDTDLSPPMCPVRARSSRPTAASQTRAVPSSLPVASRVPSGDQATEIDPASYAP